MNGDNNGLPVAPVPRLALDREGAAAALSISVASFERHVQPHIRVVRRGKLRLIDVRELARWLDENAEGLGVD